MQAENAPVGLTKPQRALTHEIEAFEHRKLVFKAREYPIHARFYGRFSRVYDGQSGILVTGGPASELWLNNQQWPTAIAIFLRLPIPLLRRLVGRPLKRNQSITDPTLRVVDAYGDNLRCCSAIKGTAGSFNALHETIAQTMWPIFRAAFGFEGTSWRKEVHDFFINQVPAEKRAAYQRQTRTKRRDRKSEGYRPDVYVENDSREWLIDWKVQQPGWEYLHGGLHARPSDLYEKRSLRKLVAKLRETDETLNPNVVAGTYDGAQCGPFLKRFGETNMVFAVVGPNAELSSGMRKVIKLLVDRLAPEAVRVWRLEGESGARVRTKGTISYIVRRRLAGASWRGIAAHVSNRVWFANGEAPPPSNGDGPRRGFAQRMRQCAIWRSL